METATDRQALTAVNRSQIVISEQRRKETLLAFVAGLMAEVKERFLHNPPTDRQMELWQQDWMKLAERLGTGVFKEAVLEACLRSKFFPLPAVIAECVLEAPIQGTSSSTQKQLDDIEDLKRRWAAGDPDVINLNEDDGWKKLFNDALGQMSMNSARRKAIEIGYIPHTKREAANFLKDSLAHCTPEAAEIITERMLKLDRQAGRQMKAMIRRAKAGKL